MGGFSELDLGVARLQKFRWQVLSYITQRASRKCVPTRERKQVLVSLCYTWEILRATYITYSSLQSLTVSLRKQELKYSNVILLKNITYEKYCLVRDLFYG